MSSMKTIFNKNEAASKELVAALGMIDIETDYSKWSPYIPLSVRKLTTIVGPEVYDNAVLFYEKETPGEKELELIKMVQQSIALFTWVKIIPTLDAQHGKAGRSKRLGDNQTGLTALQEFKDEANIMNLAYESVDALVAFLDSERFDFWLSSSKKKALNQLLIKSKEQFDEYYTIGSHRLFLTLIPIIREVQDRSIIPVITQARFKKLLDTDVSLADIERAVCRPLALLTMQKAIQRLPIEVLPDGIVQVSQVGSIKQKEKAEAEARKTVAASLGEDAASDLRVLTDLIAELDKAPEVVDTDLHISKPSVQTKGITF